MPKSVLPDLSIVLTFLRSGQGWSQQDLGTAAGVSPNLLNDYERGRKPLHRPRLEYLIAFMGLPPERIDATLATLEENRAAARAPAASGDSFAQARRRIDEVAALAGRLATDFGRSVLTLLTFEGEAVASRQRAELLWGRLKKLEGRKQLLLVENGKDFRNWALCERVAAESRDLAANQPQKALELAELALRIAELAPGEELWRRRLQGYALFHVANGHRVCQKVPAAEAAIARALKLWGEGELGDPGLLNEAIPLWIEAALRRSQRRFPEALKRIDEALAVEQGELRGKMLLSKSSIFQILGDAEGSSVALTEAAPLIDPGREPREAFGLQFNLAVDLCCSGRFEEAASTLGNVRELAQNLGRELDLARVAWLEGKVAAGLGQSAEAENAFEQVRGVFRARELAYDYALVSLDLSLVLLKEGRSGEVRTIAEEMVWIFKDQGVAREALAALRIFCEAARREAVTAELALHVASFLRRIQLDPELRFEPEVGAGAK
jgi:transcriptional regulator with XRE-family HTH domain